MLKTLSLMTALLLTPFAAIAQTQHPQELAAISNTLNSLATMQATFTQYNADGTVNTGLLSMQRPGRMRMEYNERNAPLMIVGGGNINLYDGPRDTSAEVYPLKRTPLWLLLKDNVNLTNGNNIVGTWTDGGYFWLQMMDPETPEAGRISFFFDQNTLSLQGWISQATSGEEVQVALGEQSVGAKLPASLFNASMENDRRNPR